MGSSNAEAVEALQAAFNERDWNRAHGVISDDCIFAEPNAEHKGPDGYIDGYLKPWVEAFSDAKATDVKIHDAGDTVVVEFVGRGTNDGAFGPLPASGKRVTFPLCEVYNFGPDGKVSGGRVYYDQLDVLTQLGHAQG